MYLRSGTWYRSGRGQETAETSKKSSEESVTNSYHVLEPIVEEETPSDSTSSMSTADQHTTDSTSHSMAFNVRLAFVKLNNHGAQLYQDPMSRWAVKIEDHDSAIDPAPWVNYQGSQYMGQGGERYVVTTDPENVDKWGQIVREVVPEVPPYGDLDDMKLINTIRVRHRPVDDPSMEVYVRDTDEFFHCYFTRYIDPSTIEKKKILYVYLEGGFSKLTTPLFVDKYGVVFETMEMTAARGLTWQGNVILEFLAAAASSMEAEKGSHQTGMAPPRPETHRTTKFVGSKATAIPTMGAPSAPLEPGFRGHSAFEMGKMGPTAHGVPKEPIYTLGGPTKRKTSSIDKTVGFMPGRPTHESRKVRPSNFQKWVKKFNGTGDPYDHVASFKQVARAEHVNDFHTKVEGFGMTLEASALSWFQTLNMEDYPSYEALEKDFIAAFSKTGMKHDALSKINGFQQKPDESVRNAANRLRQYLARCPEKEKPSQERLVSIFLEGLNNKELYAAIYMKRHSVLSQCINDAIEYDDNCSTKEDKGDKSSKATSSSGSVASQVEEVTKGVIEKMQQLYGPPRALEPRRMERHYVCGSCGGNHPTNQCLPKVQGPAVLRPDGRPAIWCDFDKKWGNHTTEECFNRIRFMRQQAMGGGHMMGNEGERPILVLNRQPPLPEAAPLRILGHEEEINQEQAIVPVTPYEDKAYPSQVMEDPDWSRTPQFSYQDEPFNLDWNTLMFIAGQNRMPMAPNRAPNAPLGPCYDCGGDHLVKNCPYPSRRRQ